MQHGACVDIGSTACRRDAKAWLRPKNGNYTTHCGVLLEDDRATTTGNIRRKFNEVWTCGFLKYAREHGDTQTDRQIYTDVVRNTSHPPPRSDAIKHVFTSHSAQPVWNFYTTMMSCSLNYYRTPFWCHLLTSSGCVCEFVCVSVRALSGKPQIVHGRL